MVYRGMGCVVVTHSAAGVPEHIWDSILWPLHWLASSVGYALYGCNKLWSYNAV